MKKLLSITLLLTVALSLPDKVVAQISFAEHLQNKLTRYYARHLPVKIHLTFNQRRFVPGDTAFFKVWFVSAADLRPVAGRQILHVDLIDSNGKAVQRSKVLVVDGAGFNQIHIPDTVLPGFYRVVAYQSCMEKSDAVSFFQTILTVAGPVAFSTGIGTRQLNFFPEGGQFIRDITNKVIVHGPSNASGAVLSEKGNEVIASFTLDSAGFGFFFLAPSEGQNYFVRLKGMDNKTDLPEPAAEGVGLMVTVPRSGAPVRVTVQLPASSSLRSKKYFLSMTAHDKVFYTAQLSFRDNSFLAFALPQDRLPGGIARVTVFDEDYSVVAERITYIEGPGSALAEITLKKEVYSTRDEASFQVAVRGSSGDPVAASLSVTVYREDLFGDEDIPAQTIGDNLLLYGDLSDSLSNFSGYSAGESALDSYLVTQTGKAFSWGDVLEEASLRHPFQRYLHLEGIVSTTDGKSLPDSTLVTFFLQKSVMIYEVYPERSGAFQFSLLMDFYGTEEIYYQVEHRGLPVENAEVRLRGNCELHYRAPIRVDMDGPDEFYVDAGKRRAIDRAYAFNLMRPRYEILSSLNALIEDEVSGADVDINLDDYLLFSTMSETLREVVPLLQHRKEKSRDVLRLFFDDRNRFAAKEPLIIIDGVISNNATYFLSLKPADVASIKLVHSFDKLRSFGAVGKHGIVLVETKIPGNAAVVPRPEEIFQALGLTRAVPLQGHITHAAHPRVPDLRSNIYWNPDVKTDSVGNVMINVQTSDVTGSFRIRIEGLTVYGDPFSAEKRFRVLYPAH